MMNDIPLRIQWDQGTGYCGETCFVSAGLYYGQYMSEGTVRQIAGGELLLGQNDDATASAIHLTHSCWNRADYRGFLNWIKTAVNNGHPVAIGVYMNESIFGSDYDDPEYDHIVMVVGVDDTHIYFTDCGLYTGPGAQSIYSVSFADFPQSRSGANSVDRPYSLCNNTRVHGQTTANYGIQFTGVDGGYRPVHVDATPNNEGSGPGSIVPMALTIRAASGILYQSSDGSNYHSVPWLSQPVQISSNETVYYRLGS